MSEEKPLPGGRKDYSREDAEEPKVEDPLCVPPPPEEIRFIPPLGPEYIGIPRPKKQTILNIVMVLVMGAMGLSQYNTVPIEKETVTVVEVPDPLSQEKLEELSQKLIGIKASSVTRDDLMQVVNEIEYLSIRLRRIKKQVALARKQNEFKIMDHIPEGYVPAGIYLSQ